MAKIKRKRIKVSLIPCKPTHTITLGGEKKDWGLRDVVWRRDGSI